MDGYTLQWILIGALILWNIGMLQNSHRHIRHISSLANCVIGLRAALVVLTKDDTGLNLETSVEVANAIHGAGNLKNQQLTAMDAIRSVERTMGS